MSGCLKPGCPRIAYLDPVFQTAGCLYNFILSPAPCSQCQQTLAPPTLSVWSQECVLGTSRILSRRRRLAESGGLWNRSW